MIDLAPFAMSCIFGLGLESIGDILAYMNSAGCTIGGLCALQRTINRDRTWELVFLHLENVILHESRRMLQQVTATLFWFFNCCLFFAALRCLG